MADPVIPAEPVAVQPELAPAPVAASPDAAAAPEPVAVASPSPAPVPDAAKPDEAKPVEADKPKLSTEEPSLLETFDADKKAAEKPVDGKEAPKPAEAKPGEVKPDAAKPAEPPAPVEYKYTLPETLKIDDASKTELHGALDAFRANPAEGVQGLIDIHNKKMQDFADFTLREQHRVFNETRAGWRKEWAADEQIGGSGYQTSMAAIARMRDLLVPASDRPAFDNFLRITGAGDHPVFGKLLHNAARYFDEPQASSIPTDIKPSKTNGRAPKGSLYTHPSSQNMES